MLVIVGLIVLLVAVTVAITMLISARGNSLTSDAVRYPEETGHV